jgi:hypothetical protein
VLALTEIERKRQIAGQLAGWIADARAPERKRRGLAETIR